ncbi:exo-1,4-beta-D-glucosaminidase [Chitinophaga niastensis]|uniref:Exo-1,4-beta-D-glucosaminidase n=1 Tax=Chitinophaga niastensis TaxID=536980 RepID=A0A2P8HGW6_CHINA|nr:sugar-binding domain-containing protein [Chitinophaga niastensis]PSL45459.1 exo-1,4-beta-D-glucosaminidase [Chitinophaga niastensis]
MKHACYLVLLMGLALPVSAQQQWLTDKKPLDKNWQIQSSVKVRGDGKEISSTAYAPQNWYAAKVPGTVMAALVDDGVYKNIFFDNNMEKISADPFKDPWWHRTTFELPPMAAGQVVQLLFNGINYRAAIWVNGQEIAVSDSVRGGFRRFKFDISHVVHAGTNVLAVKVTAPGKGEPTLGFVDWNPAPPDKNMGIWRDVQLLLSGPVAISQPFVQTQVDTATLKRAAITVSTLLSNQSNKAVAGILEGHIGQDIIISKKIAIAPHSNQQIVFTPREYPQLNINNPRLWWTRDLGKPALYQLQLQFKTDNTVTDTRNMAFGIRSVADYINASGHRGYILNGRKLLIRGGGWTDPMLLNATADYERAGIDYAVHMNLNTIRMEGFWGNNQHLYDLCDEKGILLMVGWSAAWEWTNYFGTEADDFGGIASPEQQFVAAQSWKDQIIWLRNHPSVFIWVYGSDKLPRPALEQQYLDMLKTYDPSRPSLSSAHDNTSKLTGPAAVKMRGPYDYVPPDYWYIDDKNGGAFGFNTETGPGPEVPLLESLQKMIPKDSLWPISGSWMYHAARGEFHNLDYYNNAMEKRLGKAVSLDDYLRKAQYLNYEGMRAMLEAFTANRPAATGIIQWMYNASWPKLWWQLYDYYLLPTGAFYGARKAGEPLHIAYNYGIRGVDVINNTATAAGSLKATIRVLDATMNTIYKADTLINDLLPQDAVHLPALASSPATNTWYLDLRLQQEGKEISRNFYVLSSRQDLLDMPKTNWYVTPQTQFADLTALQQLPQIKLNMQSMLKEKGDTTFAQVTLKNPGTQLAFMVHLDIRRQSGEAIVPVFWVDNDFTLLPGESLTINGYVHTKDLQQQAAMISLNGWNIVPIKQ